MAAETKRDLPPEIRVTLELLLDTERKIEKLQTELATLKTGSASELKLNPPGKSGDLLNNSQVRAKQIEVEINDLMNTSIGITNDIKKVSPPELQEKIATLVDEWKEDLKDSASEGGLSKSQIKFNRLRSPEWRALETASSPQTPFQENVDDTIRNKGSHLAKARGLQERYAYLDKDEVKQDKEAEAPSPSEPGEDGPDIEID